LIFRDSQSFAGFRRSRLGSFIEVNFSVNQFSFETAKKGSQDSASRLLHAHNGLRFFRPPFGTYSTPHPLTDA